MRYLLLFCLFATHSLFAQCGKVVSVKDGDTFEILLDKDLKQRVRIAFVDAPEHKQEFGEQSKEFATKYLLNQKVCIEVQYQDPYKRSVAIVKLSNGKNFNEELVKNGMAWHFVKYSKDKHLAELELQARKSKVGLWAESNPMAPWLWRKQHNIGYKSKKAH